jgi:gluconolactonase
LHFVPLSLLGALACATGGGPATTPAKSPAAAAGASAPAPADLFPGAGTPAALASELPFVSLEGPLWIAAGGGYLLFSDVVEANAPGARIYRFDPGSRRFAPFPYPVARPTSTNGLAVDPQGRLIACERYNARLVRVESDGKSTVLADGWPVGPAGAVAPPGPPVASGAAGASQPFGAPNDLVVRRDGNVYFTDSDWGARPGSAHARMAVYRLSPAGQLSRVLEMEKPNGIALSPDGATLYVGSDAQNKVWRLPVDAAGAPGAPALFIDGAAVPGGFKVPDGICVDDAGDLYVANNADEVKAIVVFDPAGRALGRIPIPERPSNCTFGGADRRTLYVTTLHAVYAVPVPTPGLP